MPKPSLNDTSRLNVNISNPILRVAKFLAKRRGTTASEIIRIAVAEYCRRELVEEKAFQDKLTEHQLDIEDQIKGTNDGGNTESSGPEAASESEGEGGSAASPPPASAASF